MSEQKERQYEGGKRLAEKGGLDSDMRDVADDHETLRAQFNALLAKLDTEGGLGGGYVTALEIAAGDIKVTKG